MVRLILCLWMTCWAAGSWAQTQTLSLEEARRTAGQAVLSGRPDIGLEIAQALLQIDANDVPALLIASQASRALGQNDKALGFARRGWALADTRTERYQAALVTAQALSSDGKRTRSQLWLRRAAQIAPTERDKAIAIRDLRYVRGRNPWRTHLTFGIQPSSNVNNGSKNARFAVGALDFTLSGDARALSGMEYSLGLRTQYTLPVGPRTALRFGARVTTLQYSLSEEARDQAPEADAADYEYTAAELSFGLRTSRDPRKGAFDLRATLGQSWYGGEPLSDYAALQFSQSAKLGAKSTGFGALRFTWQDRKDNPARSSRGAELSLGFSQTFESKDRLTLVLAREVVQADSDQAAFSGSTFRATYQLAEPLLTAQASFSAGYELRDYASGIFGLPRQDETVELGVSLFFPEQNLYGFAPTLDLVWESTTSTQELYDSEKLGLRLGLRSAF